MKDELKKLIEKKAFGKSGQIDRIRLHLTSRYNNQTSQVGDNCTRFQKTERIVYKKKSDNAKHGKIIQQNVRKNHNMGRLNMDVQNRPRLRLRTGEIIQRSVKTQRVLNHCGEFTGHYQFKKGFYGLSNIPTVFQEHIDKVQEYKTQIWLDDMICNINGTIEEHEQKLREVLLKLQEAGYRASERITELLKKLT